MTKEQVKKIHEFLSEKSRISMLKTINKLSAPPPDLILQLNGFFTDINSLLPPSSVVVSPVVLV